MHAKARAVEEDRARQRMTAAGYRVGGGVHSDVGDEAQDKRLVYKAVHQHDTQLHPGHHTKLKLRRAGRVEGEGSAARLSRRARGGGLHGKKGALNVIIHNQPMHPAEKQMAAQQGMQQGMKIGAAMGARRAAAGMAGGPPGGGGRPGMPPPGGLPTAPPGPPGMGGPPRPPMPGQLPTQPFAEGGRVRVREHTRRRAGGACADAS